MVTGPVPRIDDVLLPEGARASVVFLHGGQERSEDPVRDRHASWWRVVALARAQRRWARDAGLALHVVQFRVRGWNDDAAPSPVADARAALDQLAQQHPGRPVVLVGHSMGGRTACRVADAPAVRGVVGLAPWLPQGEPVGALVDRSLHVLHGTADRWTSPRWSEDFVRRAAPLATDTSWTPLPGAGHFMLRRVRTWNGFVEDSVRRVLAPQEASHPPD